MSTKPPSGTRDFLPDEVRRREYVMRVVRDVYESYGFEPLETPAFENIETLLGKYGEEGNKLIFKILRRGEHEASGEADLALRYDLTVPLARVVAQYQNELPKFFKRYQIQPVWRADRPARGRFREFYQCDIDAIGSTSPVVEAELLGGGQRGARPTAVRRFRDPAQSPARADRAARMLLACRRRCTREALVALDKLDKIGAGGRREGAAGARHRAGRDAGVPRVLHERRAGRRAACRRTRAVACSSCSGHEAGMAAVDELDAIVGLARGNARRTDGFESTRAWRAGCHTTRAPSWRLPCRIWPGSLGGGGRYDNLVGMFLGRDVPACGFSLGLERIIVVMTEREMFPAKVSRGAVDVMVTFLERRAAGGRADSWRRSCGREAARRGLPGSEPEAREAA